MVVFLCSSVSGDETVKEERLVKCIKWVRFDAWRTGSKTVVSSHLSEVGEAMWSARKKTNSTLIAWVKYEKE